MSLSSIVKSVANTEDESSTFLANYMPKKTTSFEESTSIFGTTVSIGDVTLDILTKYGEADFYKAQDFVFGGGDLLQCKMLKCDITMRLPTSNILRIVVDRKTKDITIYLPYNQMITNRKTKEFDSYKQITAAICEGNVKCHPYIYRVTYPLGYSIIVEKLAKSESIAAKNVDSSDLSDLSDEDIDSE